MTVPHVEQQPAGEGLAEAEEVGEAWLTDDEGSEVSDSEFGLSDRQLSDLWARVASGTWREEDPEDCHDAPDELDDEKLRGRAPSDGSASGLAPLKGRAASRDPLNSFASQRRQQEEATAQEAPLQERRRSCTAKLADCAEERPRSPRVRRRLPPATASIISSRDMQGTTWYLLRVRECGQERFFLKRYRDFAALDSALRARRWGSQDGHVLPRLPDRGLFGLRHALDIGNFNARRQQRLQEYVSVLVSQVRRFSEEPALDGFFGTHAPGKARGV